MKGLWTRSFPVPSPPPPPPLSIEEEEAFRWWRGFLAKEEVRLPARLLLPCLLPLSFLLSQICLFVEAFVPTEAGQKRIQQAFLLLRSREALARLTEDLMEE